MRQSAVRPGELVMGALDLARAKKAPPQSELEALARVKAGDTEAYHLIVSAYMKRAYFIALGFVHNQEDALDISQEAFIKAFRGLRAFDLKRPFFPWFYEIIKNLSFDHLRRRKTRQTIPPDIPVVLESSEEGWETRQVLWKEINVLPIDQREVILLRYFQQLSYQEIAETLGKPLGTIMSTLHYAKARLRKSLAPHFHREGDHGSP
jgi:RNA polymerase sigma-70 factor (ECF subfamily)